MSKKRKSQQRQPQQSVKPIAPGAPVAPVKQVPVAVSSPTSVEAVAASTRRSSRRWLLVLVPIFLVAGITAGLLRRAVPPQTTSQPIQLSTSNSNPTAAPTPTIARFTGAIGGVTNCRKQPAFVQALGFSRSTVLSTAERTVKGLIIVEPQTTNSTTPPRTYQHPSWRMGGYLGPSAIDQTGDIFVASAPRVNLIDNPPERANVIYKVDAATGVMTGFLDLPSVQAPSSTNPFGILGLTYDCDTNSMYAASVAGSSRNQELGRLYHIDLNTGKITSEIDGVDAIGLGVFNGAHGKRLYFGSARTQDVRSIELDVSGNFYGEPRMDFSLTGLGPDGNDKARKISFDRTNDMTVNGTKFTYNLAPPAAQIRPSAYKFRYDASKDSWSFVETMVGPSAVVQ